MQHSVGSKEAPGAARMELKNLLDVMDVYSSRRKELLRNIREKHDPHGTGIPFSARYDKMEQD